MSATTLSLLLLTTLPAADPAPKLADCAWLAGAWVTPAGASPACDEHWMAPAGNSMVGMFRMAGRSPLYELLLIEESSDGLMKRLRHYGPEMKDRDPAPIAMKVTSANTKSVVFTNPAGNQPKQITYQRDDKDLLTVTIETERNGQPVKFNLKFQRKAAAP